MLKFTLCRVVRDGGRPIYQPSGESLFDLIRDMPKKTTETAAGAAPANFETAMAELETLVARMERDNLPLAEVLAAYQRGTVLLAYCQSTLRDARQQVKVLEDGMLKVFDEGGESVDD